MAGLRSKQDKTNKPLVKIIEYLFWGLLIFYTNPGGIVQAFNVYYVFGKVNIWDVLFVLLSVCYISIPRKHNVFDNDFIKVKKYLTFFLIYYFLVFVLITPIYNGNKNYSLLINLIKSRYTLYNFFLFIYIYEFFKRRWDIFLKIFLFSSVIVLIIFIQGIITKVNILPIDLMSRFFVKINRHMMIHYGLMPLLIPLGAVIIVFKLNIKFRNLILIGFALMSIAWMVSLTRRHIIGIIIYFILGILVSVLITGRYKILFRSTLKVILILVCLITSSYFIFPRYVEATRIGIIESINVIEYGATSKGEKDERLGFARPFIVELFLKHPFFGTGFDNRWRNDVGDVQGYEAADYPFLAALAMFGVMGTLVFLPVYINIIKVLKKDIWYLRRYKPKIKTLLFLILMALVLYFIYDLLQYFNYFGPISNSSDYKWYAMFALYLASRQRYYSLQYENRIIQKNYL